MSPRVISYGGGVQSTAMLVLAVQGRIDPVDAALFANVGDDSEHPDSLDYVRDVARPYAAQHGLDVIELRRTRQRGPAAGQPFPTLVETIESPDSRGIPIPARMPDTGAPGTRSCTASWKIEPIERWCRENGASPDDPAHTLIGISTDEILRVNNRRPGRYSVPVYPLIELGLSRTDCARVIERAGLPVPPKSSCYFCPFHRDSTWRDLHETHPDLFARAEQLEATLIERRRALGRDPMYLTRHGVPLRDAIALDQLPLIPLGAEGCDDGYCFT